MTIAAHEMAETINAQRAMSRRLPIAIVPSNDRVTGALPRELRERFLTKLGPKIEEAMRREALGAGHTESDSLVADTGLSALLGSACATCRGDCCTGGTDHAHLDVDSLARVRVSYGWDTFADVMGAYVAHLPRVHFKGSCVYHGTQGCTLPRDMRADICNRHLCGALAQLTRAIDAGDRPPFIAVAVSPMAPRRAAIIGG